MITIKINGTRFKIPTCWHDVTYSQYVALLDVKPGLLPPIALFTGIDLHILEHAELRNAESISTALEFIKMEPPLEGKPTMLVGPYTLPEDVTLQSLGQIAKIQELLTKLPRNLETSQDRVALADLYLEACAIYCQKIIYGHYDYTKVPHVKEELKRYSCIEVLRTGGFFLYRPLNSFKITKSRYRNITQRLKKLIQDWPGFQKTLALLQPSSKSPNA